MNRPPQFISEPDAVDLLKGMRAMNSFRRNTTGPLLPGDDRAPFSFPPGSDPRSASEQRASDASQSHTVGGVASSSRSSSPERRNHEAARERLQNLIDENYVIDGMRTLSRDGTPESMRGEEQPDDAEVLRVRAMGRNHLIDMAMAQTRLQLLQTLIDDLRDNVYGSKLRSAVLADRPSQSILRTCSEQVSSLKTQLEYSLDTKVMQYLMYRAVNRSTWTEATDAMGLAMATHVNGECQRLMAYWRANGDGRPAETQRS